MYIYIYIYVHVDFVLTLTRTGGSIKLPFYRLGNFIFLYPNNCRETRPTAILFYYDKHRAATIYEDRFETKFLQRTRPRHEIKIK